MMRRPNRAFDRLVIPLLSCAALAGSAGCNPEQKKRWDDFWKIGGSGSGRQVGESEVWTIECAVFKGGAHDETADRLATSLKQTPRIKPDLVWVEHRPDESRIFYGQYELYYVEAQVDSAEHLRGDTIIELSDEIKRDMDYIRSLAIGDQYPFFTARPIAEPTEDNGPPEWDLRNARGAYTLNVGVTYSTPTLHNYKEAAVAWVRDLRGRGHEAYYYHNPDRPQTSICVGTFGEDALVDTGGGRTGYSEAVKALQNREPEFKYNLENGHIVYRVATDENGRRVRQPNFSFLVKIPNAGKTP